MINQPKLEDRPLLHYVGIRTQIPMTALPTVIPQSLDEVAVWLSKKGVSPAGAPFIRYHAINMETTLDVEVGWPVPAALPGDTRVSAGSLPAGRYVTLIYTDVKAGIPANAALLEWGAGQGLDWDSWPTPAGDAFGARVETFLTNPEDEPDPAKWETEVAIRLAGHSSR
jgi:effector-binding domain-containing protein